MFKISDEAKQEILTMQQEMGSETYLKYKLSSECCNELRYDLKLVSVKGDQEEVADFDGVKIIYHPADLRYLNETEIHFRDGGFTINNPNPLVSPF
ncbi:HesB/IscA family protein [Bacillus massiliglaciei]|uniref:HesB/IscA family protein n=1 Tax=Bacillus massiliglaciei TaxID=1816693 RepID=UPI0018FE6732|nr:iron-sulfur cluster biosynthesis family protein [Bacillus massiliglaciei]